MTNHWITRFAGEPALVEPGKAARFDACLAQLAAHPRAAELMSTMEGDFWQDDAGWCRPYVVVDGILQIPVKGVLLNNFPYQLYDWATGYEYIEAAFTRGCGDFATGAVRGIAFIGDTPGGMVAGCFDAVDRMVAMKEKVGVPVRAFAHESLYSAGYAIATVADHVTVSRTGGVGSIGVVTSHLDVSGAMDKAGLKFTYIASDPSKVEGNPYEALSDDAKARIQARIDELYSVFVAAVSRSRGLAESVIRNGLKAYTYTATQAVSNGLADDVGSLEDATSAFAEYLDDPSETQGEESMSTPDKPVVDQAAAIETAVAAAVAAEQAKAATAAAEAVAADRACQTAITGSDEAKGRESLASHIALNTDMSVDDAVKMLAASPKVSAEHVPGADFGAAMDGTRNPDVGGNDAGGDPDADAKAKADGADIVALVGSLGLRGFKTSN